MQINSFGEISEEVIQKISKWRNEPLWMLKFRLKSFNKFKESPLEQSSLFTRYNNVISEFNGEHLNYLQNEQPKIAQKETDINFLQVDNEIIENNVKYSNFHDGLILTNINKAIKKNPELVKKYLEKSSNIIKDKFEYLSDALFSTGIFLFLPKGSVINETIRYINRQESMNRGIFNKNFIILEDESSLNLFNEHYSAVTKSNKDALIFGISQDIFVGKNSKLTFTEMELFHDNVSSIINRRVEAQDGSLISLSTGYFGGKITRSRSCSYLIGNKSQVEDLQIVIGSKEEQYDLATSIYHSGISTKGIVDVKGVMGGKSQMTLKGMNKIEKKAHDADTFLGGHAILLGNQARANIIPGLEIDNRNVKAKHLAAVAPIDDELLFYMQSRALDKETSTKLIITGFLESIVKRIPIESVREQINEMIEDKFEQMAIYGNKKFIQKEASPVNGEYMKICKLSEVENGKMKNIEIKNNNILIVNIDNKIFATSGQCTHESVNLEDGFILENEITCPVHLSKFDLKTGDSLNPPATEKLRIYNVKIQNNEIYIELD